MAAVCIPPSPHAFNSNTMNGRRLPLADVPNAANSPLRALATAAVNGKRSRTLAKDDHDAVYLQPQSKKQFVQTDEALARRDAVLRRSGSGKETPLQKKLEAARAPAQFTKPLTEAEEEKRVKHLTKDNTDQVREWQKHYRKAFTQYTLYLDNVPEDIKQFVTQDVQGLGARVERFFSKNVTHVITTRPIPKVQPSSSLTGKSPEKHGNPATINPAVLKHDDDHEHAQQLKGKFDFDAVLQRRNISSAHANGMQDADTRRNVDVLTRARQMGIKIWALEKLHRILDTLFEDLTDEPQCLGQKPRTVKGAAAQPDLSALLKREQMHGAADRDMSVVPMDMQQFRGYFIYVHDMNEQTKPAMVRDYTKVADTADGTWPMLRPTAPGRCPFQDDNSAQRRVKEEQLRAKQKASQQKMSEVQAATQRTRGGVSQQSQQQGLLAAQTTTKRVLTENNNLASRRAPTASAKTREQSPAKPLDPPKLIPAKRTASMDSQQSLPTFGSAQASLRQLPRYAGGEPVASGIQPSNITSAIKSQMISSTTGAPGGKAGTSRQVHHLARKVLEKSSAPNSMPSPYMNDVRAAINGAPEQRVLRRKTRDEMAQIEENEEDADEAGQRQKQARATAAKSKKKAEKDLKPGYCENCHDKFDDFDKHILSSKHRKFARDANNWKELDHLLEKLERV